MTVMIAMFALFSSTNVFAHPGNNDLISNIGKSSQLQVVNDINIVPNNLVFNMNDGCIITFKEKTDFDRVLKAGKILIIASTRSETFPAHGNLYRKQSLFVDNLNIASISCIEDLADNSPMTIGKFENTYQRIFKIILANPQEI